MIKSIKQILISKKLFFKGIILALILMAIDLYSKNYVFEFLDSLKIEGENYYYGIEVTSFFNLVQVWNNGVSFGMMNDWAHAKILIIILNILIISILLIWLFKNKHPYLTVAIAFVIGGAFGNLVDRIINDAVADFLDFHAFGYHWPAFNAADSFVFIGVCLLLFENFFIKKDENDK